MIKLNYPSALAWMWNYCTYLGPYVHDGQAYDLGVYVKTDGSVSAAIVYGHEPGDYLSGPLWSGSEVYKETLKRWNSLKGH